MAIDEHLADRVRAQLAPKGDCVERRMMGALCFMVGGHMCCGVTGTALMVRVGRGAYQAALAEEHVSPMEMSGRSPRGFVLVDAAGVETDRDLAAWVARSKAFIATLPERPQTG